MAKARAASRKEIVTRTRRVVDEDDDQADEAEGPATLFTQAKGSEKRIEEIRVYRQEPEEGYLGHLAADATEETIRATYGGGLFKVVAKNAAHVQVAQKTIRIR